MFDFSHLYPTKRQEMSCSTMPRKYGANTDRTVADANPKKGLTTKKIMGRRIPKESITLIQVSAKQH